MVLDSDEGLNCQRVLHTEPALGAARGKRELVRFYFFPRVLEHLLKP